MSFDEAMYERIREGCQQSAAVVVPWVYDRVQPRTLIDVGGGEGWWAREFVDVHWNSREPRGHYAPRPFEPMKAWVVDESITQHRQHIVGDPLAGTIDFVPLSSDLPPETFDLALCLEVAEHVEESDADSLICSLCQRAPVVLFSAAIPGQGGHGHVNEQWPTYWTLLFLQYGFMVSTVLREVFWEDERIEPWYRQNLLIAGTPATLIGMGLPPTSTPSRVVHPDIYGWRLQERDALQAQVDEWRESALESRDR